MKMNKCTFGTDCELMLRDRKSGQIVSAIPIIPEGKENARDLGDNYGVQHDNVLIEFQVPPSTSKIEFLATVKEGLKRTKRVIGKKFELLAQASYKYPTKFLKEGDATIFGCDPTFNAWKMIMNPKPDCRTNLRSAAAHFHFGRSDFENPDDETFLIAQSKARTVKLMDIFVGIPFTILEANDRTNKARKKLYGKASEHRISPWGGEYRVLGNYWMRSPKLAALLFDLALFAIQKEIEGKGDEIVNSVSEDEIVSVINSASKTKALKLLKKLPLTPELKKRVLELSKAQFDPNPCKEWKV